MRKIIAVLLTACFLMAGAGPALAASLEYSGYYMKRKKDVSAARPSKSPARASPKGGVSGLKGHTRDRAPACMMYLGAGAELKNGRWLALVKEKGAISRKVIHGVAPADDGRRGAQFLNEMIAGNYIKICQPRLEPMSEEKAYGLFYVEPLLDSLQEMLLDRGYAKLFNSRIEGD